MQSIIDMVFVKYGNFSWQCMVYFPSMVAGGIQDKESWTERNHSGSIGGVRKVNVSYPLLEMIRSSEISIPCRKERVSHSTYSM